MEGRARLGTFPASQDRARVPDVSDLRVIGAGLPRTGTKSLQIAMERLLGGRCYHMHEVFANPDHVPFWRAAIHGEAVDWSDVLGGYVAAVDWPVSVFWRELSAAYPSAVVVLSVRDSAQTWWESADATVLGVGRREPEAGHEDVAWHEMFDELLVQRFTPKWSERDGAVTAYERHNEAVRSALRGSGRLVEWRGEDGWGPLCEALGMDVPDDPFPHANTREEWAGAASSN